MATIKKTKKAQFGCGPGGCMKSAEGETGPEYRRARRQAGERIDQRILKGIGLTTQEGIDRREGKREERENRRDERRADRQSRREERRANRGSGEDMPSFRMQFKKGGKVAKKSAVKKSSVKKTVKPSMKKGGKITKSKKK